MNEADASANENVGATEPTNGEEMKDQSFDDQSEDSPYIVEVHVSDPLFKAFLQEFGILHILNDTLTALYFADPPPMLPVKFVREYMVFYCDAPVRPFMELLDVRRKIEILKVENATLREKLIGRKQT